MPGKKEDNIEDLGNGKFRIRWQFKDAKDKRRYRQRDIVAASKKEAKKILDDINYEINHQTYIDRSRMTMREQIEEWFDFHQHELGVKERARYEESIRLHIVPEIGNILLSNFAVKEIQDFYTLKRTGGRKDGKKGGLGSGTLHKLHAILKLALDDAVKKGRIKENPIKKVNSPQGAQPGEVIFPLNEKQAYDFLDAAKGDLHYNLFVTFLGTGCRPEELFALDWQDVDFRSCAITIRKVVVCVNGKMIPRPIPKTKSSNRIIKVSRTVVNALKNQMEIQDAWKQKVGPKLYKDQGLVFASVTGGYLNPSNLNNRHFKPILRAAGLSAKIRLYDLRHTHATLLFRRCRDIKLVSERLGHKDVAITLRTYYHLLPRSEEEAVGMFDDVLTGKVLEEQDPEPPTEELFEDVCVKACVTDNVIAFPTGGLLKKKTRNCLRE